MISSLVETAPVRGGRVKTQPPCHMAKAKDRSQSESQPNVLAALGLVSHHLGDRCQPASDLVGRITRGQAVDRHAVDGRSIEPAFCGVSKSRTATRRYGDPIDFRMLAQESLPGDQLGHISVVVDLNLDPADLKNRLRMQIVFQAAFARECRPAVTTRIDELNCGKMQLAGGTCFQIVKVEFRLFQRRQTACPSLELAAAGWNEQEFSPMFKASQIRDVVVGNVEYRRDPAQELDVVSTLDDDDQRELAI